MYVYMCAFLYLCVYIIIKLSNFNFCIDAKVIVQILLLPHLIPPKGRIRLKQEHYKSSISECKNSIVLHAKVLNVTYLYIILIYINNNLYINIK